MPFKHLTCQRSQAPPKLAFSSGIVSSTRFGSTPKQISTWRSRYQWLVFVSDFPFGHFGCIRFITHRQTSNISCTLVAKKCWSLRCRWSFASRCCYNYIFSQALTPDFNALGKDSWKPRRKIFKLGDSVRLILQVWRYIYPLNWASLIL